MIDSSASQEQQLIGEISLQNAREQSPVENVTDRLLQPIEINQELEDKYKTFELMLKASTVTINGQRGNLDEWLVKNLNHCFGSNSDFKSISTEDIKSLKLITNSEYLDIFRELYGYHFQRPILFMDLSEFRKLYKKLTGSSGSDGMTFSGDFFDNQLAQGLKIVITGNGMSDAIKHEVKHTLDPQLTRNKREGKNRILEELAACWGDVIIPRKILSRTRDNNGPWEEKINTLNTTLNDIKNIVKSDTYFKQYKVFFFDKADFYKTVEEVAGYIQRLQGKYDNFQIDRMLMNAIRIKDLKKCLEEQKL